MTRTIVVFSASAALLLAFAYQFHLKPILSALGLGRIIEEVGNTACITVPELQACEKIVLHRPTGVVYLACSTPASRAHWLPAMERLNASGMSSADYIASYDPETSTIVRFALADFPIDARRRGRPALSVHGMDVVPSASVPGELFVYVVNHRVPLDGADPRVVGADSSVEVFKTSVGGEPVLTHLRTYEDPEVIITPNDVRGADDGRSFYFTNDHGEKTGFKRMLDVLGRASSSVGYCHEDKGCKIAIANMHGNNGITSAQNDTFYVSDALGGPIRVLERQSDDSLVVTDLIPVDRVTDNLSVDDDGVLWAAGLSNALRLALKHFPDPSVDVASSALKISRNTGREAFFGEKFKVEKVFEDNGKIASGVTSVARDSVRGKLYLHGLASPQLVVCNL